MRLIPEIYRSDTEFALAVLRSLRSRTVKKNWWLRDFCEQVSDTVKNDRSFILAVIEESSDGGFLKFASEK